MDQLNLEQKMCFDTAMNGHNLFISGPGGVGKSYVVREITQEFRHRDVAYRIAASTGVSALNINGSTIHSILGTGILDNARAVKELLGTMAHHRAIDRLQRLDALIIDEISMLSGDYIQMMDFWLKQIRANDDPFGGLQVIVCGDFLQLPPVEKGPEKKWRFAFQCPAWKAANFTCIELRHSFRQEDQVFINALNKIRFGHFPLEVRKLLRPCIGRELENPTHLVSTNKEANDINFQKLREHEGTLYKHKPVFTYHNPAAKKNKEWAADLKAKLVRDSLTDSPLRLKVGVPVLLLKNSFESGYVNGSRGIVTEVNVMEHGEIESVAVKLDGSHSGVPSTVLVHMDEWTIYNGDGHPDVTMRHFPIRLGWALTIHKSQGLTLNNVEIDLSKSFACGQAYVALSRMRNLEGLALTDAIDPCTVRAEPELVAFYDRLKIGKG